MSEFEREYFEKGASYGQVGGYEAMAASVRQFYAQYFGLAAGVSPELRHGAGKKALEVGCALGIGVEALRAWQYEVYATDVSAYAISQARARLGDAAHLAVADAQAPNPFGIRFDLVVAIHVVEHLRDIATGMRALAGALAGDGHLVLATPNPASISPYRRFQRDPTHVNEHPPHVWCSLLENAGLRILFCRTFHVVPLVHRWIGLKYAAVPRWLGYDTVIVARRGFKAGDQT